MISLMISRRPGRPAEKQLMISLMISRRPGRPAENNYLTTTTNNKQPKVGWAGDDAADTADFLQHHLQPKKILLYLKTIINYFG